MERLDIIWKGVVSALPFIAVVLSLIVLRSVILMRKRGTGFAEWIANEDAEELRRLSSIEMKKCPQCGTVFGRSCPIQKCQKCGYGLMCGPDDADSYLNFIHRRYLRQVIPVTVVLSFIPLLGFVIGIIYLRGAIIRPFAQYIPLMSRFKTKWTSRLIVLLLAVFQILPGFGAVSVPLVAYVKYWFFSNAYVEALEAARKEQ